MNIEKQNLLSGRRSESSTFEQSDRATPEPKLDYRVAAKSFSRNSLTKEYKKNYGTVDAMNQSFDNLQGTKNLRSLRGSQSNSSLKNSMMMMPEQLQEDIERYHKIEGTQPKVGHTWTAVDKYLLLLGLIFLITFEILLILKLAKASDMLLIYLVMPLIFSFVSLNIFIMRQVHPFVKDIESKCTYYSLAVFKLITSKILIGLILVLALAEIFPFYARHVVYLEWIAVAVLILWVPVIMNFYKDLQRFSARLPYLLLQNLVLFTIFLTLLTIQFNRHYESTFILFLPLFVNFGLNMINSYQYIKIDIQRRNQELLVHGLLLVACFWSYLYVDYINSSTFFLVFVISYLIAIEVYFYILASKLNQLQ